ncbi:MAG: sugar phosphate isomerase/epimerase family protein [Gemmatimonadaceae bacterium]
MIDDSLSRRAFIARTTAAGVAFGVLGTGSRGSGASTADRREEEPVIAVFSKHLQWLPFADVGPMIAESGFRAVDLTVRPGGHVLPEHVENDLPRAVETLRKSGLTVPLITTAITDAGDPLTRRVLATARKIGVSHYRMGYWTFPANGDPLAALRAMRPRAAAIAALNREIGIRGGYQNHVGTRVGGSVWDLGVLLEGIAPEGLGVQYDIRHAVAEGGESWPVTLRMIAPHIDTIALKDLVWAKRADGRWEPRSVPLGEGMVSFDAYLRQLLARGPLPPATMHFEYAPLEMDGGGDAKRRRETIEGMRRDLTRFRQFLAAASVPAKAATTGS